VGSGLLLVQVNDIRNHRSWFGRHYTTGDVLELILEEPLTEKPNSLKAIASVPSIVRNQRKIFCRGKLIVNFRKDSFAKQLKYGSRLLISKPVQPIRNSGNPSAFDYRRYSLFQGITHQVYIEERDFRPAGNKIDMLRQWIYACRSFLIAILQRHIRGEKELGLAEALLIGYKDDLDKTLLQSYSNTGVVHVIAISGLHLGLIYGILLLLTKPLNRRGFRMIRACMMISGLWIFSILAGAQPSVLRSAVMFSAIALAVVLERKTSIYNTMALSAFLLLCYQPFWLWDLGFQLSYTAVLSILIFFRPVYNWFYFRNKAVDAVWKLAAVTIAAQLLTTPISLFHFHQFPLLFLLTNLLAVPLSSVILIGILLLCSVFFMPFAAKCLGVILEGMIRFMNQFIENLDQSGLAIWDGISINLLQTGLLYVIIITVYCGLMEKQKKWIRMAACAVLSFFLIRAASFVAAARQQKLVVYNIPKKKAIDLVDGRNCMYLGDPLPEEVASFHIKQSRVAARMRRPEPGSFSCFRFCGKKILILNRLPAFTKARDPVDILILSGKPSVQMDALQKIFSMKQVVIDSSVPYGRAKRWQQQCQALHIPCHNVAEEGAFVINFHTPTFAAS
jgi:competence protein ComEC